MADYVPYLLLHNLSVFFTSLCSSNVKLKTKTQIFHECL